MSNAVKFTPKGGRVSVGLFDRGHELVLVVADTGIGIAPEFVPLLFDRFTQADGSAKRRHGGLGLGMAIVRHLVELHGGTVKGESEGQNRGATFTVVLPRRPAAAPNRTASSHPSTGVLPRAASLAPPLAPSLQGRRLLVVDDDEDTVQTIAALLREAGAQVSTATSAGAALDILQHEDIDVLLSDLEMPEVDGLELARRVRKLPKLRQMPAIAVSAHTRPEEAAAALSAGYDLHVAKPVEVPQLVTAIETLASLRSSANGTSETRGREP
jgi:CheY-like chemotaxis protein